MIVIFEIYLKATIANEPKPLNEEKTTHADTTLIDFFSFSFCKNQQQKQQRLQQQQTILTLAGEDFFVLNFQYNYL